MEFSCEFVLREMLCADDLFMMTETLEVLAKCFLNNSFEVNYVMIKVIVS